MGDNLYIQRQFLKDNLEQNTIFFQTYHFEITSTYSGKNVLVNFKGFLPKISVDKIKTLKIKNSKNDKMFEVDLDDNTLMCELDITNDESLLIVSSYLNLSDLFIQANQIETIIQQILLLEKRLT